MGSLISRPAMPRTTVFDYVIVGSGAAGSVLAERLSADPRCTVLVIEAGGSDRSPVHLVPMTYTITSTDPRYSRQYATEPDEGGRVETWPRGWVLGGSTTVNGTLWNRGWSPAYDALERAGNRGWNWQRFVEAFQAIENHELGSGVVRGGEGPVAVSLTRPHDPVSDAILASLDAQGIALTDDVNGSGGERAGYSPHNARRGLRVSAARAFLRPAARRANVTVLTGTQAARITFTGTRASGVEAVRAGVPITFTARREVLVCAGSLESPLLLERSGIGDPEVLRGARIPVHVARPGVGENLREHHGILLQYRLKGRIGFNHELRSPVRLARAGAQFLATGQGVVAHAGVTVMAMFRSDPATEHPDVQAFAGPVSVSGIDPKTGRQVPDRDSGAALGVFPTFPSSAGSIHVRGPGLDDPPRLALRHLSTDHDRAVLVAAVRRMRTVATSDPFAGLVEREREPTATLDEDAAITAYGLEHGFTASHPVGTCAMGPDQDAVLDDRLRVRGTTGLRVVDASVFPGMPSGNTAAPTMAMAWIAGGLIHGEGDGVGAQRCSPGSGARRGPLGDTRDARRYPVGADAQRGGERPPVALGEEPRKTSPHQKKRSQMTAVLDQTNSARQQSD